MRRIDIQKISKNPQIEGKLTRETAKALRQVNDNMDRTQSLERWKMAQKEMQEKVIGTSVVKKQKLWMTKEILQKIMEQRRLNKQ